MITAADSSASMLFFLVGLLISCFFGFLITNFGIRPEAVKDV